MEDSLHFSFSFSLLGLDERETERAYSRILRLRKRPFFVTIYLKSFTQICAPSTDTYISLITLGFIFNVITAASNKI